MCEGGTDLRTHMARGTARALFALAQGLGLRGTRRCVSSQLARWNLQPLIDDGWKGLGFQDGGFVGVAGPAWTMVEKEGVLQAVSGGVGDGPALASPSGAGILRVMLAASWHCYCAPPVLNMCARFGCLPCLAEPRYPAGEHCFWQAMPCAMPGHAAEDLAAFHAEPACTALLQ